MRYQSPPNANLDLYQKTDFLIGVVEFGMPLGFPSDCLTAEPIPIIVGGMVGDLFMAQIPTPEEWILQDSLDQVSVAKAPHCVAGWTIGADEPLEWCGPLFGPGYTESQRAAMRFPISQAMSIDELANHVYSGSVAWLSDFVSFIQIITKHVSLSEYNPPIIFGKNYLVRDDAGTEVPWVVHHKTGKQVLPQFRAGTFNVENLKNVCTWCSTGRKPVVEYMMLRQADHAFCRMDFVCAIMDAVSALGISIDKRLYKELALRGDIEPELLMRDHGTLLDRIKLLAELGLDLPTDVSDVTSMPLRNELIHSGRYPSHDEALACLNEVETWVTLLTPTVHD